MTIEYYTKNVYGKNLEYITNKDIARLFQQITTKKTIDPWLRNIFSKLGIYFKEIIEPKL